MATIHLSEDGNARPLTCYGTHVNVEALQGLLRSVTTTATTRHAPSARSLHLSGGSSSRERIVDTREHLGLRAGERLQRMAHPFGFVQHIFNVGPPNTDTCSRA